jgi:CSLREA domain-containing protein
LVIPVAAQAATLTVTTTADTSGSQCTLRNAITAANSDAASGGCPAGSGVDTIDVTATGQIGLGSPLPQIGSDMTIAGSGSDDLDVHRSGAANFRVFDVAEDATVTISGLKASNGSVVGRFNTVGGGAGIQNAGVLTLLDVTLTGNAATDSGSGAYAAGGAISNTSSGALDIVGSTISGNQATGTATGSSTVGSTDWGNAEGAAIMNVGTMTIDRTTVHGNTGEATSVVHSQGGGAISGAGAASITASTIDGNATDATSTGNGANSLTFGGGIDQFILFGTSNGALTLDRVTVTNNSLTSTPGPSGSSIDRGGGIALFNGGAVNITSSTIVQNSGATGFGGGNLVFNTSATLNFENTIVADPNSGNLNCRRENGTITSLGHNLSSDGIPMPGENCNFDQSTDQINTEPGLDPLADNGGPTETMSPASTSPVVDQGTAAGDSVDQRGYVRPRLITAITPSDDGSDIGAFELQTTRPSPDSLDFGEQPVGTSGSPMTLTLTNEFGSDIVIGTATLGGTDAASFEIGTDACSGTTLANGDTCDIDVSFLTPGPAVGSRSATLNVPDDTASALSVDLSGEETSPVPSRTPAALAFGDQLMGTSSAAQTVTLSNTGVGDLQIDSIAASGADAGQFSIGASDCTVAHGGVLATAQSCSIHVTFSPASTGAKSASLEMSTDVGDLSTSLAGTGTQQAAPPPQSPPTGLRAKALKKCKKKKKSAKKRKKCKRKAKKLPV